MKTSLVSFLVRTKHEEEERRREEEEEGGAKKGMDFYSFVWNFYGNAMILYVNYLGMDS